MTDIESLIEDFTRRLAPLIESQTLQRARNAVESAFGAKLSARRLRLEALPFGGKPRKKAPIQLCPVPGCKNPAAPVFGMVCSEHKNLSKNRIKQYREARRAAKTNIPAKPVRRKGKKRTSPGARKRPTPKKTATPRKELSQRKPSRRSTAKAPPAAPPSPAVTATA